MVDGGAWLAFVLMVFSACSEVRASGAMVYDAAYQCNSAALNKGMAEICATQWPELASRSHAAYAAWTKRNAVMAGAAAKTCSLQLHALKTKEKDKGEALEAMIVRTFYRRHRISDKSQQKPPITYTGMCILPSRFVFDRFEPILAHTPIKSHI